jgi:hypothetical protein
MYAVDFSPLHSSLSITFVIPIITYVFLFIVAMPHWRRFLRGTLPGLLIYFLGCILTYLMADLFLNILRISGSAYIFASFLLFALVLICSAVWTIRKIKKTQGT